MKTNREQVWDMVYDMTREPYYNQLPMYEGVKEWEEEVKDIVYAIEALASSLENHIQEKFEYEMERKKGE